VNQLPFNLTLKLTPTLLLILHKLTSYEIETQYEELRSTVQDLITKQNGRSLYDVTTVANNLVITVVKIQLQKITKQTNNF